MDSIKDADYCVIVATPSIFGLHNLKMIMWAKLSSPLVPFARTTTIDFIV